MSYHIYTTEAIVLSSRPLREADRIYSILTRDLGLIRATAAGVRKEASKLRGLLEPVSLSTVSFVKGKEYWRLTSAHGSERVPSAPEILRPLALLEQLVQGEEPNSALFDAVERNVKHSMFNTSDEPDIDFESRFAAEILHALGYLNVEDLQLSGKALVERINAGIQESGLG